MYRCLQVGPKEREEKKETKYLYTRIHLALGVGPSVAEESVLEETREKSVRAEENTVVLLLWSASNFVIYYNTRDVFFLALRLLSKGSIASTV